MIMAAATSSNVVQASTLKTLYSFCSQANCADGVYANGIIADASGRLFGTTFEGGTTDQGVVFEFVPRSGKYTVLYNFCSQNNCADGQRPRNGRLVMDTAGNLYGVTSGGGTKDGGVAYELVRGKRAWREKVLYSFCAQANCTDGNFPTTSLTYAGAASGALYDGKSPLFGQALTGGATNNGIAFALKRGHRSQWKEEILYNFCSQANCSDGSGPWAPMIVDSAGNLYGTTTLGGSASYGAVFELSPHGRTYSQSVIYSFCSQSNCADGGVPYGGLVMDGSGNLYGNNTGFGADGYGVVFRLAPQSGHWQYSVLASFAYANGASPQSSMTLDASGNLLGVAPIGGAGGVGTVFQYGGGALDALYSFCGQTNCTDGAEPTDSVSIDGSGTIWGTTWVGGANYTSGGGTIFSLAP